MRERDESWAPIGIIQTDRWKRWEWIEGDGWPPILEDQRDWIYLINTKEEFDGAHHDFGLLVEASRGNHIHRL